MSEMSDGPAQLLGWAAAQAFSDSRPHEAPSLAQIAKWWPRVSPTAAALCHQALEGLLGPGWRWNTVAVPGAPPTLVAMRSGSGDDDPSTLTFASVHRHFLDLTSSSDFEPSAHPVVALCRGWLYETPVRGKLFRPSVKASLPRLHALVSSGGSADNGGFLLTDAPPPLDGPALPFSGDDSNGLCEFIDSCPSWLLEMHIISQRSTLGGAKGLDWGFRIVVGGLLHLHIDDRDGRMRDIHLTVDDIVDWLAVVKGGRWSNRSRDYVSLACALERCPDYRLTIDGVRYWLVSSYGLPGKYLPGARCVLTVRVPPGAAHGVRISWPRFRLEAAASAIRGRAYLSIMALLDRSARNGHPITRYVRSDVSTRGGAVRRGALKPNPLAKYAPFLPERHLGPFLAMGSDTKATAAARQAVHSFAVGPDRIIDLERDGRGWRVFGVLPRLPRYRPD